MSTLAVRGMECREARTTIGKVATYGRSGHYHVTGWTGSPVKTLRRFDCVARYGPGIGANVGGITFRLTCHDFKGDAIYYREDQDNE